METTNSCGGRTALQIANTLAKMSAIRGLEMSGSKLQRLLYFSQGWYLAIYGEPLFEEDFEGWVHGPAVPEVSEAFRYYFSGAAAGSGVEEGEGCSDIVGHLEEILETHGEFRLWELDRIAKRGGLWAASRYGLDNIQSGRVVIPKEDIKKFFSGQCRNPVTEAFQEGN